VVPVRRGAVTAAAAASAAAAAMTAFDASDTLTPSALGGGSGAVVQATADGTAVMIIPDSGGPGYANYPPHTLHKYQPGEL
jgi:hypothetical protein